MVQISYRRGKFAEWVHFYLKDYSWTAAKQLHGINVQNWGKENCHLEKVEDSPGNFAFHKDWTRI